MSEEAEKIIQTIKQGSLPSLTINNDKGTQSSQHGIDHTNSDYNFLIKIRKKLSCGRGRGELI